MTGVQTCALPIYHFQPKGSCHLERGGGVRRRHCSDVNIKVKDYIYIFGLTIDAVQTTFKSIKSVSGSKVKDNLHTDLHIQEKEIAASKCCCSSNYFEYLDVYGEKKSSSTLKIRHFLILAQYFL